MGHVTCSDTWQNNLTSDSVLPRRPRHGPAPSEIATVVPHNRIYTLRRAARPSIRLLQSGATMPDGMSPLEEALGHDPESMDRALTRSLIDAEYRRRLLTDPKEAFAEEGIEFPDSVTVSCHEVSMNDRHFFLPPMVADPQPVDSLTAANVARTRPDGVPPDAPVTGSRRPSVARPFAPIAR